jgi:thiamine pyrophosphokinase
VPFTFPECFQRNEVFKSQRDVIIFQHKQHKSDLEKCIATIKNECKSYPCVYNPDEEEASSPTSKERFIKSKRDENRTEEESMQLGTFGTNVIWI